MDILDKVIDLWKSYNINSEADYQLRLDNFKVLFAYNSNKIENEKTNYYDTREIFENGIVTGYTGDIKTLFEQQNQKMCYEFLLPHLVNKKPININLIKEIHKTLTIGTYDERRYLINKERPGEFKKNDYVVGRNEIGSNASNVEQELSLLIREINVIDEKDSENLIIISSYFHCKFEQIHPFADGNGRVGRTLLNYFLMINDLPPLIIYDEDKKIYYECLEHFDNKDDLQPMINFIKYEIIKTWEKTLSRQRDNYTENDIQITKGLER